MVQRINNRIEDYSEMMELTVFGMGPEEFYDAMLIDSFTTPTSESYLLDIGAFDDGMRMYVVAERFEGEDWTNSFPEMDVMQLANYLEGMVRACEESEEYRAGLRQFVDALKRLEKKRGNPC